jgi:hypothetical protein
LQHPRLSLNRKTDDSMYESAEAHLSLVYDAFLALFDCQQPPLPLTETFIYQFIGNGAAADEHERVSVRRVLCAMNTIFMRSRAIIREKVAR